MSYLTGLIWYLMAGFAGGLAASRLKLTGGTMIGAMLAVILLKTLTGKGWDLPRSYSLIIQVLVGVMIGAGYSQETNRLLARIAWPMIGSTLVLTVTGILICLVLVKIGLLDAATAYLSTSPGGMSALIPLAGESQAELPVVAAFHFFRVVFIILTAPLVFQIIRVWFSSGPG